MSNVQVSGNVQYGSPDASCSLTDAIREMLTTIEQRSRRHRNLVVVIVILFFTVPIVAVIASSWHALLAWNLIIVAVGVHLSYDCLLLHRWLQSLANSHQSERFEVTVLCDSIETNPNVPNETAESMLMLVKDSLVAIDSCENDEDYTNIKNQIRQSGSRDCFRILAGTLLVATALPLGTLAITSPTMPIMISLGITIILWLIMRIKG
ncbi:hypothetical protein [Roseiconus lacunae]|uniref:hypothetical protein n=1 Tax=Roseiconus lacunae TaxID=2605694 RepID=UPI0011F3C324|nr:hypothetical protein [Roseiconus lacunae]MCD0460740.1 hypothetical protein [Roseiconus lacunae]